MTKLETLIQQLCPDGVEYKELGEIATQVYRGNGIKRTDVVANGVPCVRYGEIYTTYSTWFSECVSHTTLECVPSPKYFEHGDILFAITGESVEDIAKCTTYMGNETCLAGGDIVVVKHLQNPKYISYALSTSNALEQKAKGKVKNKVVHASVSDIKSLIIPVPPLEVQQEIVRILDSYTARTAELQAQLSAELTARKQQYAYYKRSLYTNLSAAIAPRTKLKDFCDLLSGFPFDSSQFTTEGIRLMRGMNVKRSYLDFSDDLNRYWKSSDGLEKYLLQTNDIIISMDGSLVGKSFGCIQEEQLPLLLVQRVARIRSDTANNRFIYHYISSGAFSNYVESKKTGGAVPHISMKDIGNFAIPLPPLAEQERIVAILDRFDALCNDLTSGLPAEIEARQKQYEYYRDKLLTFPEKVNGCHE